MRFKQPVRSKKVVSEKQEIARLVEAKNCILAEIDTLTVRRDAISAGKTQIELELTNLGQLMEDSTKMHRKVKEKVREVSKTRDSVMEDLAGAKKELCDIKEEINNTLDEKETRWRIMEEKTIAKCAKEEKRLSVVQSDIGRADARLAKLIATESKLEVDIAKKKEDAQRVADDIVELTSKKATLNGAIKSSTRSNDLLTRILADLNKEVEGVRAEVRRGRRDAKLIATELETLAEEKVALEKEIGAARLVLLTLDNRIKTVEKREGRVKALYGRAGVEIK